MNDNSEISQTAGSVDFVLPPRFPPFPPIPNGVTILPFKDFRASGYKLVSVSHTSNEASYHDSTAQEVEVDVAYGIPTIKIATEEERAKLQKAKKRKRNPGSQRDEAGRIITWWEEWAVGEEERRTSFPLAGEMEYTERIHQAADDFRAGRPWPTISTRVRLMWDHFGVYIGLLDALPVYRKVKHKNKPDMQQPIEHDNIPSDEDIAPAASQLSPGSMCSKTKPIPNFSRTINRDIVQDEMEPVWQPNKRTRPDDEESMLAENLQRRLKVFVDDLEGSVKVFLGAYMRERGLMWLTQNLTITPIIISFFLRFLLRNAVFADSRDHEDSLRRALFVAELAKHELPRTARMGLALPDAFSVACTACWGAQATAKTVGDLDGTPDTSLEMNSRTDAEDSAAKDVFIHELGENAEVVPAQTVLHSVTAHQVLEEEGLLPADDAIPDSDVPDSVIHDTLANDPWAPSSSLAASATPAATIPNITSLGKSNLSDWTSPTPRSLLSLLGGPSVLPLTHMSGVVERSTRRIRAIVMPYTQVLPSTSIFAPKGMLAGFARVYLGPWWVSRERAETEAGVGAEVGLPEVLTRDRMRCEGDEGGNGGGDEQEHDEYSDDVVLLMEPEAAETLGLGMGLQGVWVQVVRRSEKPSILPKDTGVEEKWWYAEELSASFPSYFIEMHREWDESGTGEEVSDDEE